MTGVDTVKKRNMQWEEGSWPCAFGCDKLKVAPFKHLAAVGLVLHVLYGPVFSWWSDFSPLGGSDWWVAVRSAVLSHLWSNHQRLKVSFAILCYKYWRYFAQLNCCLDSFWVLFFDSTVSCLNDIHLDCSPRFLPTLRSVGWEENQNDWPCVLWRASMPGVWAASLVIVLELLVTWLLKLSSPLLSDLAFHYDELDGRPFAEEGISVPARLLFQKASSEWKCCLAGTLHLSLSKGVCQSSAIGLSQSFLKEEDFLSKK